LQAFGNPGVKEVGAHCEYRVSKKEGKGKKFADFVWAPRTVIELKSRGEPLHKHFNQVLEYWNTICPKLKYMVLCNFDEFWIYDPNVQMYDPVHILKTKDLLSGYQALSFLFPKEETPVFNNNHVAITKNAAKTIGSLYLSLTKRGVDKEQAQRFVLQIVVALFSEDVELIPKNTLFKILHEAIKQPVTKKELYDLFTAMAEEKENKKPKKYRDISYFNGGIFNKIEPIEFTLEELFILADASEFDWSQVSPSIFGAIFESSVDNRHIHGEHYTFEVDIQKIVTPTIVRPFQNRIDKALANKKTAKKELAVILKDIREFKVLDPACGSGNFLYVAFKELRRLERRVLDELDTLDPKNSKRGGTIGETSGVHPRNFYGIDVRSFALELAKISLCIGRKISSDELGINDNILPFDNLDKNFQHKDALLEAKWPEVDAIIGNPPFQSKNKMQEEFGRVYLSKLRESFPEVSGMADYCVYWIYLSHKKLRDGCRAGLVGTNTIRQNQSRESGLDYVVSNGGTITEAVSTQVWSGDAQVHVSIVNWVKGKDALVKKLFYQDGNELTSPWKVFELESISSSLSYQLDVTKARKLKKNNVPKICFQGQTHGHLGFLLQNKKALEFIKKNKDNFEILKPYLTADELLGRKYSDAFKRFVIDFHPRDILGAKKFKDLFEIVEEKVLPTRIKSAEKEKKENEKLKKENSKAKINRHHQNFLARWWLLSYPREDLMVNLKKMKRYIVCAQHPKRNIIECVSTNINPNAALMAFRLADNYSFGVLQSDIHWSWVIEKGSTIKAEFRYTS
jgi:type II restriction/modification system DNA methylase subunit YeeA